MIPRLISAGLIMVLIAANLGLHYYAVTRSGAVHTATVQARGESVYTPFRPLHTGASPAAVEVPETPLSLSASPPDAAREAMVDDEPIKLPADELNHDETHLLESDESTQFLFHVVLDGTPEVFSSFPLTAAWFVYPRSFGARWICQKRLDPWRNFTLMVTFRSIWFSSALTSILITGVLIQHPRRYQRKPWLLTFPQLT